MYVTGPLTSKQDLKKTVSWVIILRLASVKFSISPEDQLLINFSSTETSQHYQKSKTAFLQNKTLTKANELF